jgi:hypothetical protein
MDRVFCRLVLSVVVVAVMFHFSPAHRAGESKDKPTVRELKVVGYPADAKGGSVEKPVVIDGEASLKKHLAEEKTREQIRAQVDFQKEQVLLFAWSGSGMDQLSYDIKDGKSPTEILFSYQAGRADDLKHHVRFFAIPKTASWRIGGKKS